MPLDSGSGSPPLLLMTLCPMDTGEKSVYIVNGFIRLTREEAMAIRWHMGFSGPEDARTVGQAFQKYPLAFALATADMEASYFLENEENP